jgi:hypothetical protein
MAQLEYSTTASRTLQKRARTATRQHSLTRVDGLRLGGLIVAAALLVLTMFMPYWSITLHAPQYPKGLTVNAYVNEMSGDVAEVDGLNHYIGMIKLQDAATFERAVSRFAIPAIGLLAVLSFWVRGGWRWLVALPIVIYPVVFTADLFAWLYYAGHSLDPTAALSSSIKPFTPAIFGTGVIGQFHTEARFEIGFFLALLAAAIVVAATIRRGEPGHDAR